MKRRTIELHDDDMLPEYDFTGRNVVRGKHAKALREGYNVTIHKEDEMNDIVLNTQTSYDQVAEEYAEKFKDEMDDKPFDRDCLDRLAREV